MNNNVNNNEQDKFEYSYSAPTQDEREQIEDIKKSYMPKTEQESKMQRLKRLDCRVKSTPIIWSLATGVFGALVFGVGLTSVLVWDSLLVGIIVCIVGCIPMGLAYPIYRKLKNKLTAQHKDEILSLSDELLNK